MLARPIASKAFLKSRLLSVAATATTAVVLLAAFDAQAACTPIAGAGLVPPPGTVVTCTGTTINQNAPNGYGTGSQTDLTINVEVGALVQGSPGLNLNSDNTINNFGTISSLTGAPGLFLQSSDNTINNSGIISSASGEGIRSGAGTTITNSGAISGNIGIVSGAGTTITNSGTITGSSVGVATVNLSGAGNTIINSGTISGGAGGAISLGGGSTLTLLPSSVIVGNVVASTTSTTDALQLGGNGSGSFNVSLIGSAQQYRGFDSFQKVGDSTWTLTGTGAQNWTITQGTLVGTTSSLQGQITDNAALVFDQATNGTFASSISGTGTLTKQNTGTLTFTGANTYTGSTTISAGTLQLGNGGASGSIVGDVTDNATLSFNRSDGYTFGGIISGSGALEQNGTGSTTLTPVETYTGATTVNDGTLLVNGSIASSSGLTVNASGTIGGTGTLPSTIISGGTLAPGNSIGTVAVQGNLAFSPTSTYLVEISPTASDRTNVTGTATLAGTVHVVPEAGSYAPGTTYTILNATGGVIGTFSALTFDSAFLCTCLSYDANNVYLTITQTGLTFAGVGQTPNQIATGAAVEQLGTGNPIYDVVVLGNAEQARAAFDLLSGEIHASAPGVILYDSHYVRDALIGRMRQTYGSKSSQLAALGAGGPVVASIGQQGAAAPLYALGYAQKKQAPYAAAIAPGDSQFAAWGQALGAWGDLDSNGNAATLRRSLGGIITGFDVTFDRLWRLGFAAGYTQSSLDVDARLSSGSVDAYHLALYGGGQFGVLGLRTGAAYSWDDINTTRDIAFAGGESCCASAFSDRVTAGYTAGTAQAFGEVGYAITFGNTAAEPFAGLAWVHLNTDGLSETGGAAALTAASQSFDAIFTTLGLRAASALGLLDSTAVTVHGALGWRHAFGDVTPAMALAFASNGVPFTIAGVPIADNSLVVDAGLDFDVTANGKLGITYSGQLASDAQDHAVLGNLVIGF
jgi:outer membrane autotransporter protein